MIYALILFVLGILLEHQLGVPFGKVTVGITLLSLLLLSLLLQQRRKVAGVLLAIDIVLLGIMVTKYDAASSASIGKGITPSITAFMEEKRATLAELYKEQGLQDDEYAIAMAMTLGEKQHVSDELRDIYSITGGAHVFALSGMHLGILFMLLTVMLPSYSMPRLSTVVQLLMLWTYVVLVDMHASILRAAIMLSIYSIVSLFRQRPEGINVLCVTAFLLLIISPRWLFDVGFQMSFMAVLSILILFPRLRLAVLSMLPYDPYETDIKRHRLILHGIAAFLLSVSVLSFTAQLGVAPLIAHYFHRFSCYFWLTNIFVSPLSYIILAMALLMFIAILVAQIPGLGFLAFIASASAWLLKGTIQLLNTTLAWIAQLPMASIENIHINAAQTILLYALITAISLLLYVIFGKKRW